MYKVFFNEKQISFVPPTNITLKKPGVFYANKTTVEELRNWFFSFIKNKKKEAVLIHSTPEYLFQQFALAFNRINAAGGLVKRGNQVLFILRNGVWDLPKGKIDKNESAREAAIREVEEECGIRKLQIVKQLSSTFHIYQSPYDDTPGQWIFKKTFWFEMDYAGKKMGKPQTSEGISEVKWFAKEEFDLIIQNTHPNLLPLIESYLD